MATIKLHKSQFKNESQTFDYNGNLLDWMIDKSGISPDSAIVIFVNGKKIADTTEAENKESLNSACDINIGLHDSVDIVAAVNGAEALIIAAIIIGSAAIAIALTPKPKVPGDMGKDSTSSNNQLNAANNAFRQGQAIPNLAGQQRSYPDFIQPSFYVYENNRRVFTELLVIGEGYHQIDNVFDGTTLFDDIPSSSATIYQPNESVPSEFLLDVRAAEGSIDFPLDPPGSTAITINITGASFLGENRISAGSIGNDFSELNLTDGDLVEINVDYDAGGTIQNYSSTRQVDSFGDDFIVFVDDAVDDFPFAELESVNGILRNQNTDTASTFFTLDGDAITAVRFQLKMPQGIRDGTGNDVSVNYALAVQQIDSMGGDIGSPITMFGSFVGNTQTPQFQTREMGGLTAGRYKARAIRQTASLGDNAADQLVLEQVESVTPYSGAGFGNITKILARRGTSAQQSRGSSTKINADVVRRLELFDPNTGTFDDGVFTATRSFAQYVMYVLCKQAGVAVDDVDYVRLFAIEDSLSDPQLGYFDATFDDDNVAVKERVDAACNVARVKNYETGNRWNFVREEAQPFAQVTLTRRDLAPNSSAQTWEPLRDDDFDSITIVYTDPDTNSEAYIDRRINSATGAIESGLGDRTDIIELFGCRNVLQATNRAELEIRRLRYQRYQISDVELGKLSSIGAGERFRWCDVLDADVFHGEVLAQSESGNVFTTSEPFTPQPGVDYYVYLTDEDGVSSNAVLATARSDGNQFGFEAAGLVAYTADGYEKQLGSVYVIASEESVKGTDFILIGRDGADERGQIRFQAAIYDDLMFEED